MISEKAIERQAKYIRKILPKVKEITLKRKKRSLKLPKMSQN